MCGSKPNGSIRLKDGNSDDDYKFGRVEVCIDGDWTPVCNEGWDEADARVACRQHLEGTVTQGTSALGKETAQSCVYLMV